MAGLAGVTGSATRDTPSRFLFKCLRLAQQLRQLGDIRRDPPRLVAYHTVGSALAIFWCAAGHSRSRENGLRL